jgi:hypothetical protein
MRSERHAWERSCSLENLVEAYLRARRGKRATTTVRHFELEREQNLARLALRARRRQLLAAAAFTFRIREPKRRRRSRIASSSTRCAT